MLYNQFPVEIGLTIRPVDPAGDQPLATYLMQRRFKPGTLPMLEVPLVDDLLPIGPHSVRITQRKITGDAYLLLAELEIEPPEHIKTRYQMDVFILGVVQNFVDMDFCEVT